MNAGPDVERSIAQWLSEESPGRAPDRILANAGSAIDRTKQRRLAVAWREPVTISLRGLAFAATLVIVAVVGAGFVGRSTASTGGQPSPSPATTSAPAASAGALTQIADYRSARDAVCRPATQQLLAIFAALPSGASTAEQAANIDQTIALVKDEIDQLAAIDAPPALSGEHAADVQRHRDALVLIQHISDLLHAGKQAEANAVDEAVGSLSSVEEAFEQKYGLAGCP